MEAIKPTYVTFEQAQKLKQMDFNIPCQYLYVDGEYRISFEEKGELFDNKYPSTQKPIDWCLAPEQWQVVEFLRINHGIWIYVIPIPYSEHLVHWRWRYKSSEYKSMSWFWEDKNDYLSPQEAYSSAIDYVLENILP